MKKTNFAKTGFYTLAFAALGSPLFAQLPRETQEQPKQELKVTIIKKTIDEKGVETVEKIERSGNNLQELKLDDNLNQLKDMNIEINIEGLDKINKEQIILLQDGLGDSKELKNIDVRINRSSDMGERPVLGVTIEITEAGVKILTVDGAAKEAGLKEGDIVLEIDGQKISSVEQLQSTIKGKKAGDVINITYKRDGQNAVAKATLKSAKAEEFVIERRIEHRRHIGTNKDIDPCKQLEELLGEPFIGVFINTRSSNQSEISSVMANMGAAKSELRAGDVITKINGEEVSGFESLRAVLKKYKPGQKVRISYAREGKVDKTRVTLSSMGDRDADRIAMLEKLCEEKNPAAKSNTPATEPGKTIEVTGTATLDIFPNPTADVVNINFAGGNKENATITVSSIEGKEIIRLELVGSGEQFTEQIDLSKLSKGLYLITVKQGNTLISKQVALK